MTPFARLCLASGLGLLSLIPTLGLPQPGAAHDRTYVVQPGDTLSGIALRFHVGVEPLIRLNGLQDPDHLQAGRTLTLPGEGRDDRPDSDAPGRPIPAPQTQTSNYAPPGTATTYVVVRGDTLGALSARFGVPLAILAGANGISRPDLLRVGQRLLIPASSTARLSTAPPSSTPVPAGTVAPGTAGSEADPTTALPAPAASQAGVGALLASEAQAYGIDPALVKAVAWQESGWRMITAADGGIGVMQLMPATAAWVGPALLGRAIDPYNLQDNIQAGVALLASYLRQYGDVQMALAAYNEGQQGLAHGIGAATARYIASVLALRARFMS